MVNLLHCSEPETLTTRSETVKAHRDGAVLRGLWQPMPRAGAPFCGGALVGCGTAMHAVPMATVNPTSPLDAFLASAERRAWLHARLAVRNDETALDIVQDAMLRLAEHYSDRPPGEWPMLFQRILQNAILDHFRRQKVRDTWTVLVSALLPKATGATEDELAADALLERIAGDEAVVASAEDEASQHETLAHIAEALGRLPVRQRQAFLLRYWEGFDLADTAAAMGCSQGSVKTHCSRACHALAQMLVSAGVAESWAETLERGHGAGSGETWSEK